MNSLNIFLNNVNMMMLANVYRYSFSSVQFSHSVVSDSLRPHESAHQASLSITISQSSLKLTSIESVMPSSPWDFGVVSLVVPGFP